MPYDKSAGRQIHTDEDHPACDRYRPIPTPKQKHPRYCQYIDRTGEEKTALLVKKHPSQAEPWFYEKVCRYGGEPVGGERCVFHHDGCPGKWHPIRLV